MQSRACACMWCVRIQMREQEGPKQYGGWERRLVARSTLGGGASAGVCERASWAEPNQEEAGEAGLQILC